MSWKLFKKYFSQNYFIEIYYDEKDKEFNDLKLGQLSMDEFIKKFICLQRYNPT